MLPECKSLFVDDDQHLAELAGVHDDDCVANDVVCRVVTLAHGAEQASAGNAKRMEVPTCLRG